jgi:autoinducer 2-degrading protein
MRRLALIVEYETHPGQEAAFDEKIRVHAKACLAEEPGCLRFEVLRPIDDEGKPLANRFMANELFADEAALKEHRATPRWLRMSEVFKQLLVQRRPILSEVDLEEK